MSDDNESDKYIMKKTTSDIETSETVYAQAPSKEEVMEIFEEAKGDEE